MNDRADSESLKEETRTEFGSVLEHLRKDHPEVVAGAGAVVAGTLGGAALMTAQLSGTLSGLPSTHMVSGLAARTAAGWLTPVAVVLAFGGYVIGRVSERRRRAKLVASLRTAVEELHRINERLTANADYYRREIAEINAYIDHFENVIRGD